MALRSPPSSLTRSISNVRSCAPLPPSARFFSNTAVRLSADTTHLPSISPPTGPAAERPRWSYTPEKMIGPGFSLNIVKDPRRQVWAVNDDPKKLDAMYNRLLGPGGDRMLPDEVKWLAVTHRSFDYGRRGHNTKLGYYGRLLLAYEVTRSILVDQTIRPEPEADEHGRQPFKHAALTNVDKLVARQPQDILDKARVTRLAAEVGLTDVVRWKPAKPENLEGSGMAVVMTTSMYAIVGALSLRSGNEVAMRMVRERIIRRLWMS